MQGMAWKIWPLGRSLIDNSVNQAYLNKCTEFWLIYLKQKDRGYISMNDFLTDYDNYKPSQFIINLW